MTRTVPHKPVNYLSIYMNDRLKEHELDISELGNRLVLK